MASSTTTRERYGLQWPNTADDLQIEMAMIRRGGKWTSGGKTYGMGLFHHFMAMRKLVWPDRYRHRWTDLIYKSIIENKISILVGPASSQKTSHASEYCLLDYWCHPENTLVILTTVSVEKLDSNIWAEVKMLFQQGRDRFPYLAGNVIDHRRALTTDKLDPKEGRVRDMRKGVMCKPCYDSGKWVGDAIFVGIKQQRIRFVGDELQYMAGSFVRSWSALYVNPDVKIIGSGNPNHDPNDPLGIAAEPLEGWASKKEPEKTEVWKTRYKDAICVNLVGTDSPNMDVPPGKKEPFRGLIGREFIDQIIHDYGLNSPTYYGRAKGVMNMTLAGSRVIDRAMCRTHHAFDKPTWGMKTKTKVYALDPAYGGGDRCVEMWGEFGEDVSGMTVFSIDGYSVIKIAVGKKDMDGQVLSPEDQIAFHVREKLAELEIPPSNAFYDSFGKGTVGFAFARVFGMDSPIPVDSGAQPTSRPVRQDLYVEEKGGEKRLKTCREHYSKFVTEMWFSVRYTIEASQLRGLTDEVMEEGCMREHKTVQGNKIEVEPKDDMKERTGGKSPDLFDALAILTEGARQRGFLIARLGKDVDKGKGEAENWLETESREWTNAIRGQLLSHT